MSVVMRRSSALILVTCPITALVLVLRLGGEFNEATLSAVFVSTSGAALCLQITGALLLLTSVGDDDAIAVRVSYALLPMLGFAFSGHAAGMVPIALGIGEGTEQTAPLARAVIGGLIFSTIGTLTVLPAVYAIVQKKAKTVTASLHPLDPNGSFYDPK